MLKEKAPLDDIDLVQPWERDWLGVPEEVVAFGCNAKELGTFSVKLYKGYAYSLWAVEPSGTGGFMGRGGGGFDWSIKPTPDLEKYLAMRKTLTLPFLLVRRTAWNSRVAEFCAKGAEVLVI